MSVVSQLQAEIDNLAMHLIFTQGVSEELRSNVQTMKNATRKAGAEKTQAEEQKLKQVEMSQNPIYQKNIYTLWDVNTNLFIWFEMHLCHQDMYVERLIKDMETLTQQIAMYEAQTSAQAEDTQAAKEALSEVWHYTIYM